MTKKPIPPDIKTPPFKFYENPYEALSAFSWFLLSILPMVMTVWFVSEILK